MLTLGLLIPYLFDVLKVVGKSTVLLLSLFIVSLFSAFAFSEADKAQQFWGVFGRGTGVLSYLVLALIFFLSNFLASREFNKKVIFSLVVTTALMSAYCVIQILKLDPIGWSAFFPFGTLGNVNFLSGYMGIALVAILILSTTNQISRNIRISLSVLFIVGFFSLYKSDSTQGYVAFFVGISTYLVIKSWRLGRPLFLAAITAYTASFASLVAGLFDKGPLRDVVYQFTVLFRADYMHAAIEMLIKNPLNGVGIDAYDDWYRSERGMISALRTSINRTANTAHNIVLDLGSGGGFPLMISYLALIVLVAYSIAKGLRSGMSNDPYFMSASMSWISYQVQAAVSINQIGVGVWGWLLGGLIVGLTRVVPHDSEASKLGRNRSKLTNKGPNTPPALAVMASVLTLSIGFILAYPPLKTDADYLAATKSGSAQLVADVSNRATANAFILSQAAGSASSAGLTDLTREIVSKLNERFPRNLYGRLFQYERFSETEEKKKIVFQEIVKIDPYLAICYEPNPQSRFRSIIQSLPSYQKYELARGWGLTGSDTEQDVNSFDWARVSQPDLLAKLDSFCGNS
jgi:O-antigen ligase